MDIETKTVIEEVQVEEDKIIEARTTIDTQEDDEVVPIAEEDLNIDLTEDIYVGTNHEDIVQNFVCMICYGIVYNPLKCLGCESLFCSSCVKNNKKGNGGGDFDCFKNCGSKECSKKLSRMEKVIMNQLVFSCQNQECCEEVPYGEYLDHLENKCQVLRYKSLFLNGTQVCENQIKRDIQIKMDSLEQLLKEITKFDHDEYKPDWEYNTPWSSDTDEAIKGLENPKLNDEGCFTIETVIYAQDGKKNNGLAILSWKKAREGFEWIAPRQGKQCFYVNYDMHNTGKETIQNNKWYVLALQFQKKSDNKYLVRSFINRKLDVEFEFNEAINFSSEGNLVTIGDTLNSRNGKKKFEGNIEYVKIWKRTTNVGPYSVKEAEVEKKEEVVLEEQKVVEAE